MKKLHRYTTGFLFSTPSFFSGAGTVMNLAGNYYDFNASETDFEADEVAIANDFRMVGQDFYDVLESIKIDNEQLISAK
ncbi:MAG: hypothetical protein NT004_03000 [Bacteroidetes bacterium]|nr:hypothetical protein [Bacteroidota bacterium]